jgi:hypothetical protein
MNTKLVNRKVESVSQHDPVITDNPLAISKIICKWKDKKRKRIRKEIEYLVLTVLNY